MQVNATLIAAQQAARDARARLQVPQAPQAQASGFATALQGEGFAPLPLKQTAPAQPQMVQPAANPVPNAPLGSLLDIKI